MAREQKTSQKKGRKGGGEGKKMKQRGKEEVKFINFNSVIVVEYST